MEFQLGVLTIALCVVLLGVFAIGRAEHKRVLRDTLAPDRPIPFGNNVAWLAIRTQHTVAVVEALKLVQPKQSNWSMGLQSVMEDGGGAGQVFVSPPIDGWTFVIGLSLPHPMGARFKDKVMPLLADLGARFPDVQYFLNYAEYDYFSWQRFQNGRFVRVFAANDEGVASNKGAPTSEERALGLKLFELRGVRDRQGDAGGELLLHPTETHVLTLAQAWSLNPLALDTRLTEQPAGDHVGELGYLGVAPATWRAELAPEGSSRHAA